MTYLEEYKIGDLNYGIEKVIHKSHLFRVWKNGGRISDNIGGLDTARAFIMNEAQQSLMDQLAHHVAGVAKNHTLLMDLGQNAQKWRVTDRLPKAKSKKRLCKAWPRCACLSQGTVKDCM